MQKKRFRTSVQLAGFCLLAPAFCLLGSMLLGCHAHTSVDVAAPSQPVVALSQSGLSQPAVNLNPDPHDAQPALPILFRVECYQLKVPVGAVSKNAALWKRMNEQCVDVATSDLLCKNGFRVGIAPFSEWSYVKDLL